MNITRRIKFFDYEPKIISIINSCVQQEQLDSCEAWLKRIVPSGYFLDEVTSAYISGLIRMKRHSIGGYYEQI